MSGAPMPEVKLVAPVDSVGAVPPPPGPAVRSNCNEAEVPGYRIVGLLGHGGMGVVYSAVDEKLGRAVALKILPMGWSADSELAERLRAEAAALARMQHPNIVQIFEVGTAHGRPYLSLELVSGGSLAERLRDGPMDPAASANMIAELAKAVGHAHGLGIVHRDLKPGNILMADRGVQTVPTVQSTIRDAQSTIAKITDFGLAKTLDSGHTRTGAVLGTPSYMAPEQTGGGRDVGPPADIYALGAVLYECLTGRPPFRAASELATLDLVRSAEPVSLRRLQPGVPRDLETVCLKCLAKAPAQRYESAQSLADDLENYLAGRPVRARRAGLVERIAKWTKRRPAGAALVGLVAVGIAAGIAGIAIHTSRLKAALQLVNREKTRANQDYLASRSAMKGMLKLCADPRYHDVPRAIELRNAQYEQALAYYASVIARQDEPDLDVRMDVAMAYHESAVLKSSLGRPAIPDYREAVARFRAIAADAPEDDEARYQLGFCLGYLAQDLVADQKSQAEATDAAREAVSIQAELVRRHPHSAKFADGLAHSHNHLGAVYFQCGDFANADRSYAAAADIWAAGVAEHPNDRGRLQLLAAVQVNRSVVAQNLGRRDEALKRKDEAMGSLEKLLALDPGNRKVVESIAILRVNWAYTQRPEMALAEMGKNLAMLAPMLATEPNDADLRHAMYCTVGMRSMKFDDLKRPLEAAQERERAVQYSKADDVVIRLDAANHWVLAGDSARALTLADPLVGLDKPAAIALLAQHLPSVYARASAIKNDSEDLRREHLAHGVRQLRIVFEKARRDLPAEEWRRICTELLAEAELRTLFADDGLRALLQE